MTSPIGKRFQITSWRYLDDHPGVEFSYFCDVFGAFRECVVFPALTGLKARHDAGQARIIDLLHAVLGTSYYKCAAAREISLDAGPADGSGRALIEGIYGPGLGEFYVRSGLGYPYPITFTSGIAQGDTKRAAAGRTGPSSGGPFADADALVGFGGGKDSYVAMDIVRRAVDKAQFFRVRSHLSLPCTELFPDDGTLYIDRFLDTKLREANAKGAFNGHVPVTAMNSLIALLAAKILGIRHVIFANERSADEGTAMVNGYEVNHQYSKSFALERLLWDSISGFGPDMPGYFSILRPVSELWVARHLADLPQFHDRFMSCNRNYRIGSKEVTGWCGACPKCAFTFLLFSPFFAKDRLVEIFRANLLDDPALLPVFEEMVGLRPVKPWECVGTVEECRTIMALIAGRSEWAESAVVSAIAPRLADNDPAVDAQEAFNHLLLIRGPHNVPEPFLSALKAVQPNPQVVGADSASA